ncbi:NADH-quinone oxidoreductase subunit K [Accumulibacter sp.]|uniref:NADH-quinone oxidoreductase subunit K n=1 Tax=Accumulibacter sp. TaxID=2053492 RepID=UPI0025EABEB1|nr:NADH-quinone oxidoreductase subunit K [Accumulibacter sp.]MCM8611610.1 NADH-quinone oxidoreductase subunit K [Accumulibacter sp.]MCM8635375.1 NADH-quinone oxidoreductase subunit K [Accumulibacter sp.]MCM8638980.1 NADH-quinone oxidoreductase subunit K [Accumulibacter sp.]
MIWAVALALAAVIAAGTYLASSRDLLRCLIGLALVGNGINLLVFASGRLLSQMPPFVASGAQQLAVAANPLPQALVLTAIVISFVLLCFSLVLAIRLLQTAGSADTAKLRAAEPVAVEGSKPALEETA